MVMLYKCDACEGLYDTASSGICPHCGIRLPTPEPKTKSNAGQPTKYKPEYCEQIIEHMKKGGYAVTFAAKHDLSEKTIYNYMQQYPEFLQSYESGRAHWMNHMLKLGHDHLIETKNGDKLNTALFTKLMKIHHGRKMETLTGSIAQRTKEVIALLQRDEITLDQYNALLAGLKTESEITHNISIAPAIRKLELEQQLREGKMSKANYDNEVLLIEKRYE